MTNEDAVNMIGQLRMYISGGGVIDRKLDEAVQMAIEALQRETSNDAISRQVAIDALADYIHNVDKVYGIGKLLSADDCRDAAKSVLDDLPSVRPYTDEEIQKIQELEQAQLDKAFELGKESAKAEIIHCGECKHKGTKNCVANVWTNVWGAIFGVTVKDDFYCGLAERRTDD